jgi:hypothetical protein
MVLSRDPELLKPFADERFTTRYPWRKKVVVPISESEDQIQLENVDREAEVNRWKPVKADPDVKAWTDDYADVLMVNMLPEIQKLRKWLGYPIPASIRRDILKEGK